MRTSYKIFSDWSHSQTTILKQFGIVVKKGYDSFCIDEGALYYELGPYLDRWEVRVTAVSKFSKEEETNAANLVFLSPWANGYPMPDDDDGFQRTTYDDIDFCPKCGGGLRQKEPFRIRVRPKWSKKRKLFTLNWIHDEIFVHKEFYEMYFKPLGVECNDVLLHRKDTIIDDAVQLTIKESNRPIRLDGYPFDVCVRCNRRRYKLINSGFFPPFTGEQEDLPICKSREWFGTGASTRKYIFISQTLRKVFEKEGLKVRYMPCAEV
jgi:hypothetical protein